MTDDLVAFLKARLDEDEQVALAAAAGTWLHGTERSHLVDEVVYGQSPWGGHIQHVCNVELAGPQGLPSAAHIARHDPARVLAEVQAKRRIIGRFEETAPPYASSRQQEIHETLRDEVLEFLALPYASHPGYRAEWSPAEEVTS